MFSARSTRLSVALAALALGTPLLAEETREMGAHEHGVGQIDIAFENDTVAVRLVSPGADIVGFEYAAESDEDKALVEAALDTLRQPVAIFSFPSEAGCRATEVTAALDVDGEHDDHEHDDHAHGDKEHADHDDHAHGDKEHTDHDDHAHGEAAHGHKDHDHDDAAEHAQASHSEFAAEAVMTCTNPGAIDRITFTYFETFPNAQELEVQMISTRGAQAFEVERDTPTLMLEGLL
ncbi:MAG: DUF2796 domain-containing protein [Pseudomonadota bacterium]